MASSVVSRVVNMDNSMFNGSDRYITKIAPAGILQVDKLSTVETLPLLTRSSLFDRGSSKTTKRVSFNEHIASQNKKGKATSPPNDQTCNHVDDSCVILVPTCKKICLVNKFPNENSNLRRNGKFPLRKSMNTSINTPKPQLDEDNIEKECQDIPTTHVVQLNRSTDQQTKHRNRPQIEHLYWRMFSTGSSDQKDAFLKKTILKISQIKTIIPKTVEIELDHDEPMKSENSLQYNVKYVRNVKGTTRKGSKNMQRRRVKTVRSKLPVTVLGRKQTQESKRTQKGTQQVDVSKPPGAGIANHTDNFQKYVKLTRVDLHPFDVETIRNEGSSVDSLSEYLTTDNVCTNRMLRVQSNAVFHPFRVSSVTRNKSNQKNLLHKTSTAAKEQYKPQLATVRRESERLNEIEEEQDRMSGTESNVCTVPAPPQSNSNGDSVFSQREKNKLHPVQHSLCQLHPEGFNEEMELTIPSNSQSTASEKTVLLASHKKKSVTTKESLPGKKSQVNSVRTVNQKISTAAPHPRETKNTLRVTNNSIQNRKTNLNPKCETSKFRTANQIFRNIVSNPDVSSKLSNSDIINEFPTTAALWRNAAYVAYAESGERAKFPDDVIEVVQYNKNSATNNELVKRKPQAISVTNGKVASGTQTQEMKAKDRDKNATKNGVGLKDKTASSTETKQNISKEVTAGKVIKKSKTESKFKRQKESKKKSLTRLDRSAADIRKTEPGNSKITRNLTDNTQNHITLSSKRKRQRKKSKKIVENKVPTTAVVKSKKVVVIPYGGICRKFTNKQKKSQHIPSHVYRKATGEETELNKPAVNLKVAGSNSRNASSNKNSTAMSGLLFKRCNCLIKQSQPKRKARKHGQDTFLIGKTTGKKRAKISVSSERRTRKRTKKSHMQLFKDSLPPGKFNKLSAMMGEDPFLSANGNSSVGKSQIKQINNENSIHITKDVSLSGVSITGSICSQVTSTVRPVLSKLNDSRSNHYSLSSTIPKTANNEQKKETYSTKPKFKKLRKRRSKRSLTRKTNANKSQENRGMFKRKLIQFIYSLRKYNNNVPVNSPLMTTSSSSLITDKD